MAKTGRTDTKGGPMQGGGIVLKGGKGEISPETDELLKSAIPQKKLTPTSG